MDFDKLQKLNALAKSLVDNGLASNLDEATEQAKTMVEGDATSIDEMQKTVKENSDKLQEHIDSRFGSDDEITEPDTEPTKAEVEELGEEGETGKTEAKIDVKTEAKEEKTMTTQNAAPAFDEAAFMKKVQKAVQGVMDEFASEIKTLKDKVDVLNVELANMKNRPMGAQPAAQPTQAAPAAQSTAAAGQPAAQQTAPAAEAPKEAHPKGGDVSSDDVSIEKYFYCGNK